MAGAIRRVPAIADAPRDPDDQRARGVHARQRVHPRRVRRPRPVRRRRLLRARHRGRRRHRPPGGVVDRRRASPSSTCGRWTSAASAPQYRSRSYTLARSIENYATYYDIHYPNEERRAGPAAARVAGVRAAARRSGRRSARRPRGSGRTGSSRTPAARASATAADLEALRPRGWAGRALEPGDRRRGAGDPDDGRPVRRDVVRQDRGRGPGRGRAAAVAVRQRRRPGGRQRHLHPAAQPPRRHRVRPDRDPGHARPLPAGDGDGVRQPRPRLDPAPRAARRVGADQRPHLGPRLLRAVGPARPRHPGLDDDRRRLRRRRSRTSRPARSRSATCPCTRCGSRTSASSAGSSTRTRSTAPRCGTRCGRAGAPHGLVAGGYRAIDALRLEKGYRAWAADITPEETPFEAGLGLRGRARQRATSWAATRSSPRRAAGPRKRLRCLVLDDPRSVCLGNEPVRIDGPDRRPGDLGRLRLQRRAQHRLRLPAAGRRRSAAGARSTCSGRGSGFEVAREPLFDPSGSRIRS